MNNFVVKNFALIGAAGYIAPRHMKAIKNNGHKLVGAYDVNDSVGILDSLWPDCKFFIEYETFYDFCYRYVDENNSKLDYVVVCSPNHLHHAHIVNSLRLGCDVICEKPLVPEQKLLDDLALIEKQTSKKVYSILQLRHHDSIKNFKNIVLKEKNNTVYDAELTYITSRGNWYKNSWKGDNNKSFGISTNIGIHFFDMLHYIFGDSKENILYLDQIDKASGYLVFERAKVKWFLSIDYNDLPTNQNNEITTYRSIKFNNKEIEFSKGFTDLHDISYQKILSGEGFTLNDARSSIKTVEEIRIMDVKSLDENAHPLLLKGDYSVG